MLPDVEGYRRIKNAITGRTKYVKGEWSDVATGATAGLAEAASGKMSIEHLRVLGFVFGVGIGVAVGGALAGGRGLLIGVVSGAVIGVAFARLFVRLVAAVILLGIVGVVLTIVWSVCSALWNS